MNNENYDIDFVIMWVDPSDELWLHEKEKFSSLEKEIFQNDPNLAARYRDWDNLQYWFRGVETFAPWVRKIYFVTWNSIPSWLNTTHPKLQIVLNKEILPDGCDPVFSPNPLEINLHKIPGIAEHFVYFNDDMFVINQIKPTDFYINGLPREMAVSYALTNDRDNDTFPHMLLTMTGIINGYFDKREIQKKHWRKWLSPKYGKLLINTIMSAYQHQFSGILVPHLPSPMLKSTYEEVWQKIPDKLSETTKHKFRTETDVTQYIFRYWAICKGIFYPTNYYSYGKEFFFDDTMINRLNTVITNKQTKLICINDRYSIENFEKCKEAVKSSFQKILPEKSSFER